MNDVYYIVDMAIERFDRVFVVCLVVFISAGGATAFIKCGLSSSNLSECVTENMKLGIKFLINGVPEWGLRPIIPLPVSDLVLGGIPGVSVVTRNASVLVTESGTIVERAEFEQAKNRAVIVINHSGSITIGAEVSGGLFAAPIVTKTKFLVDFNDTIAVYKIKLVKTKKPTGKRYFKILQQQINVYIGNFKVDHEPIPPEEEFLRSFYELAITEINSNIDFFIANWGEKLVTSIVHSVVDRFRQIISKISIDQAFDP